MNKLNDNKLDAVEDSPDCQTNRYQHPRFFQKIANTWDDHVRLVRSVRR